VSLLTPWALAALVLLVPLILLHLQRRPPAREVPSLLLWRELALAVTPRRRRLAVPPLPVLLALQAAALGTLTLGLTCPASHEHAARTRAIAASRTFVVDNSLWMTGVDVAPDRFAGAKRELARAIAAVPPGVVARLVVSGPEPRLIAASADRARVLRALQRIRVSTAPSDLSVALALANGLAPGSPIVLARAPEDPMPALSPSVHLVQQLLVGRSGDDQAIVGAAARCGVGGQPSRCEVFASLRNTAATRVSDVLAILAGDRTLALRPLTLTAGSSTNVAFETPAGTTSLGLELTRPDAVAILDRTYVSVPAPVPRQLTVVGDPSRATPLAAALAAVPGVSVRVSTAPAFRRSSAGHSSLLVLAGRLPAGGLPPAPALLLIGPPRLPGRRMTAGTLANATVSGTDPSSRLLVGVDLTSLAIETGAASRLSYPPWLQPVAWSPSGTLIAAGSDGHRRVAVLAFDPARSNLTELPAFPVLMKNILEWAQSWVPAQAISGTQLLADAPAGTTGLVVRGATGTVARATGSGAPIAFTAPGPGVYTVTEQGSWGRRTTQLSAGPASAPAAAPATVSAAPASASSPSPRSAWWRWFVLAGLLLLGAEWLYATRRRAEAGL
jgi:hypothetical protein